MEMYVYNIRKDIKWKEKTFFPFCIRHLTRIPSSAVIKSINGKIVWQGAVKAQSFERKAHIRSIYTTYLYDVPSVSL